MADVMMMGISEPDEMEDAVSILLTTSTKFDTKLGAILAVAPSPNAARDAVFEFGERGRFDMIVCFGRTWQTFEALECPDNPIEVHIQYPNGQTVPSFVVCTPSTTDPWWSEEDNISEFYTIIGGIVANRVMALNSNIHHFLPDEAPQWN